MKKNKHIVVTCTKKTHADFARTSPLWKTYEKNKDFAGIHVFDNNKRGLSACYNEAIEKYKDTYDSIIFVHDDVSLEDIMVCEKLDSFYQEYDVVGLAGTKRWVLKSPAVWNNGDRADWSGAVGHTHNGEYWVSSFGKIGEECVILDGLFLAVKTSTLGNTRFDERFTFHHYDIDFCLTAKRNKLRLCTAPIWTIHHSIGDWKSDPVWHESNARLLKKYDVYKQQK